MTYNLNTKHIPGRVEGVRRDGSIYPLNIAKCPRSKSILVYEAKQSAIIMMTVVACPRTDITFKVYFVTQETQLFV